ncbi:ATP-grasp domain-containing protein [Cumulibacter manganitolerans]|uniref:ATP-grasp domain-containing protein n=1 Tax=Cumulibacter manganitolerans TaxID=1884992 RepID=UPI0012969E08|nr:hypothetical protein [Cumulibacter manganitolerans]
MIERLAWVSAREARGQDEDEPLALEALTAAGVTVEIADWHDPDVDWGRFDRAVLRSPWDYPQRMPEFLAWLDRVAARTELVNPPEMVRWSLSKEYLADLADAGIPITPTEFVRPGSPAPVRFPEGSFVVKPAVGAGSRDAASYHADQHDAARAHVERLRAAGQVVLVQPFLESIAADGEWPLVFFAGELSHAASKRVALPHASTIDELFAAETNTHHEPTAEQAAVAQAAVDLVAARFGTPAYARVDLVRDNSGRLCVMEVELVEPSLFLPYGGPEAAQRLAAALVR